MFARLKHRIKQNIISRSNKVIIKLKAVLLACIYSVFDTVHLQGKLLPIAGCGKQSSRLTKLKIPGMCTATL